MAAAHIPTDTAKIKEWRSIVTLIVFVLTNLTIIFPFTIPLFVPRFIVSGIKNILIACRILSKPKEKPVYWDDEDKSHKESSWVRFNFPMNFVTAPLIGDLFLLAILAIGREEVYAGTIGANNISPIDIMAFFITLAYIAISIDASGLIRYLAFKVLQWGGKVGHRLFFFLYAFFFLLGSFVGNDPIILSGTAFLAYMTRVSSNIVHPRAWIFTQFTVANIASAILVSSNPTNLVLAGAFEIRFIAYTANMIVPVVATIILLFPFLLYILFADEALIPSSIYMHELPEESKKKKPLNPNIPFARDEGAPEATEEQDKLMSLEEIMNPFLDKKGAGFGAFIMAVTLILILSLNAATSRQSTPHPVFWITCPAAFVTFVWDMFFGWTRRKETREIAKNRRREVREARETRRQSLYTGNPPIHEEESEMTNALGLSGGVEDGSRQSASHETPPNESAIDNSTDVSDSEPLEKTLERAPTTPALIVSHSGNEGDDEVIQPERTVVDDHLQINRAAINLASSPVLEEKEAEANAAAKRVMMREKEDRLPKDIEAAYKAQNPPTTLQSLLEEAFQWAQDSFPTPFAVVSHLPFALVPFGLTNFILVQGLVTKGWVPVFAHGWDHWVNKTGTIGAVGGMGFLSVVLCNFAGTNIGATILLSRVIQTWEAIHKNNGIPISNRNFWGTVYSMAIGVNYGAFSAVFSASLAGLLWRDILARKHIRIRRLEFARVNFPIIAIAMCIGCSVLVGQIYITRDTNSHTAEASI